MKRGIFLSIILGLCLITCIQQVMAQKQSRMEKLLRYLNDNDADKWQKNREKLDDETPVSYTHLDVYKRQHQYVSHVYYPLSYKPRLLPLIE